MSSRSLSRSPRAAVSNISNVIDAVSYLPPDARFWSAHRRMRAFDLGPDPRKALGPAVMSAASTGRTHDRTQPDLHHMPNVLAKHAPSTHDPKRTSSLLKRVSPFAFKDDLAASIGPGIRSAPSRPYAGDQRILTLKRVPLCQQDTAATGAHPILVRDHR